MADQLPQATRASRPRVLIAVLLLMSAPLIVGGSIALLNSRICSVPFCPDYWPCETRCGYSVKAIVLGLSAVLAGSASLAAGWFEMRRLTRRARLGG